MPVSGKRPAEEPADPAPHLPLPPATPALVLPNALTSSQGAPVRNAQFSAASQGCLGSFLGLSRQLLRAVSATPQGCLGNSSGLSRQLLRAVSAASQGCSAASQGCLGSSQGCLGSSQGCLGSSQGACLGSSQGSGLSRELARQSRQLSRPSRQLPGLSRQLSGLSRQLSGFWRKRKRKRESGSPQKTARDIGIGGTFDGGPNSGEVTQAAAAKQLKQFNKNGVGPVPEG
jgi:hypothetical protein